MRRPPELPTLAELAVELTATASELAALDKRAVLARLSQYPHDVHEVDLAAPYGTNDERVPVDDLDAANTISSRIKSGEHAGKHTIALDLDVPARLVPSSTPGHSHLYVDVPMTWSAYLRVLEALADAGVVEPGYVRASDDRGFTALRLPWVRKEREPE